MQGSSWSRQCSGESEASLASKPSSRSMGTALGITSASDEAVDLCLPAPRHGVPRHPSGQGVAPSKLKLAGLNGRPRRRGAERTSAAPAGLAGSPIGFNCTIFKVNIYYRTIYIHSIWRPRAMSMPTLSLVLQAWERLT